MIKPLKRELTPENLKALDTCRDIHKLAEEFYQYLAEIHHEDREIARMWSQLALDKCNHSNTFKMVDRLKGEGISKINISNELADNILAKMKSILKGKTGNRPSILGALCFSVKMEEKLNCVHLSHVVEFYYEQDAVLMASSLKSTGNILHMLTEEYMNLTVLESETFE
jgi:rubrerythrin